MGVGGLAAALARAGHQHGVITLAQLADHDVSRQQLRTAVTGGLLIPIAPRVFAAGGSAATTERSQMAGLLCLGPAAVLSHESAARLHDFDRCLPDVVELTLPRATAWRAVTVRRAHDGALVAGRPRRHRRMAVHVGHPHRPRPGPGPCRTEAPRGGHRQRRAIGGERTNRVGQAARADPGSWPVGCAPTRRAARRRRWAHHARARLPGPDASWRPPPTDDPARPRSRRTNRRPRRLLLRAPRPRRRGVGQSRAQLAGRAGQRRPAAQRAAGPRPPGLRVHVGAGHSRRRHGASRRAGMPRAGTPSRPRPRIGCRATNPRTRRGWGYGRRPRARLMTRRWTSLVPSPISRTLASR